MTQVLKIVEMIDDTGKKFTASDIKMDTFLGFNHYPKPGLHTLKRHIKEQKSKRGLDNSSKVCSYVSGHLY